LSWLAAEFIERFELPKSTIKEGKRKYYEIAKSIYALLYILNKLLFMLMILLCNSFCNVLPLFNLDTVNMNNYLFNENNDTVVQN
jgi:hypothetical protein